MLNRRNLVTATAAAATAAVAKDPAWAAPAPATPAAEAPVDEPWLGGRIATGGKGYAPTPMGQVHYRDVGPRDTKVPFFLVHQSPMSMMEFADIQNILVDMGVRTIIVDTPGYGNSDTPEKLPTLDQLADNMVAVMEYLKLPKVAIAGHHTGAGIVTAFAGRHPDRVAAYIVHDVPMLDTKARLERLEHHIHDRSFVPQPKLDGSHMTRRFQARLAEPGPPPSASALAFGTWMAVGVQLAGYNIFPVLYAYDLYPDAKAIKAPGLIIADTKDVVFKGSLLLKALRPDFTYVEFSQEEDAEAEIYRQRHRWAKLVVDFVAKHVA